MATEGKFEKVEAEPDCCVVSVESGKKKCCKSTKQAKEGQMVESKLSQVLLGVVPDNTGKQQITTRYNFRFAFDTHLFVSSNIFDSSTESSS